MTQKMANENAKKALNMLKMEAAMELGYNYNPETNKVESNADQSTLDGIAKNVLAGEEVGGQMTKNLVSKAEEILVYMAPPKVD